MKNRLRQICLALAAAVTLGGIGCADVTPELWLQFNTSLDDSCIADLSGSTYVSRGTFDVSLGTADQRYLMFPLFENSMSSSLNADDWDANQVSLRRAQISLSGPDTLSTPLPQDLDVVISGAVSPGDVGSTSVVLLDPSLTQAIAASPLLAAPLAEIELIANVQLHGRTAAGRKVQSNELRYPITVCNGCLQASVVIPNDDGTVTPVCQGPGSLVVSQGDETTVCNAGQDFPFPCTIIP